MLSDRKSHKKGYLNVIILKAITLIQRVSLHIKIAKIRITPITRIEFKIFFLPLVCYYKQVGNVVKLYVSLRLMTPISFESSNKSAHYIIWCNHYIFSHNLFFWSRYNRSVSWRQLMITKNVNALSLGSSIFLPNINHVMDKFVIIYKNYHEVLILIYFFYHFVLEFSNLFFKKSSKLIKMQNNWTIL